MGKSQAQDCVSKSHLEVYKLREKNVFRKTNISEPEQVHLISQDRMAGEVLRMGRKVQIPSAKRPGLELGIFKMVCQVNLAHLILQGQRRKQSGARYFGKAVSQG